jgi:hypothetical protein
MFSKFYKLTQMIKIFRVQTIQTCVPIVKVGTITPTLK